jgi:hypothetical protein
VDLEAVGFAVGLVVVIDPDVFDDLADLAAAMSTTQYRFGS